MNAKTTAWLYYHTGIDMMHRFIIFLYNSKQTPSLLLVDHTHSNLPKRHNWPSKSSSSTVSFFFASAQSETKACNQAIAWLPQTKHAQGTQQRPRAGRRALLYGFQNRSTRFTKNYEN
jgi:hypothetical protein